MNSALTSKFRGTRVVISKAVSTNYTLDDTIEDLNVDATSAPVTITLPLIASGNAGRVFTVRKVDISTNLVTVQTTSPDLFQGGSSIAISTTWQALSISNDGTQWYTAGGGGGGGGGGGVAPGTSAGEVLFCNTSLQPAGDTRFTWDVINHRLRVPRLEVSATEYISSDGFGTLVVNTASTVAVTGNLNAFNNIVAGSVQNNGISLSPGVSGPALIDVTLPTADVQSYLKLRSQSIDGASAMGVAIDTAHAFSTAGAKLLSLRNNGTEKSYFGLNGGFVAGGSAFSYTDANAPAILKVRGTQSINLILEGTGGVATPSMMWKHDIDSLGVLISGNGNAGGFDIAFSTEGTGSNFHIIPTYPDAYIHPYSGLGAGIHLQSHDGISQVDGIVLKNGGTQKIRFNDGTVQTTAWGNAVPAGGITVGDDRAAIQAALDAGGLVLLNAAAYYISKPLLITQPGTTLQGASMGGTTVGPNPAVRSWSGPAICFTPNDDSVKMVLGGNGVIVNPATGGGTGHALNLMDCDNITLDGQTACSIEAFVTIDSDDAGEVGGYTWILGAIGQNDDPSTTPFTTSAWSMQQFRDGGGTRFWRLSLSVGGTLYAANIPGVTLGHKTHLLIDYDGSTGSIKGFVDGVGTVLGTVTPSSLINQYILEGVYLGDRVTNGIYNGGGNLSSIKGSIGGIHIRNATLHQSNFTPPTSNPTPDLTGNTLCCLNFDVQWGPFQVGQGYLPGLPLSDIYFLPRQAGQAPNQCFVRDMTLGSSHGTAMFVSGIEGGVENIYINFCNVGIEMYMDAFLTDYTHINVLHKRFGLIFSGSSDGVNYCDTLNTTGGGVSIYGVTSWPIIRNWIYTPNSAVEWGGYFIASSGFSAVDIHGFGCDIENPSDNMKGLLYLNNIPVTKLTTCTIDTVPIVGSQTPPGIVIRALSTGVPVQSVTLDTCMFVVPNGTPCIKQMGTDRASIVLLNCRPINSSISDTLSNDLTNIIKIGGAF